MPKLQEGIIRDGYYKYRDSNSKWHTIRIIDGVAEFDTGTNQPIHRLNQDQLDFLRPAEKTLYFTFTHTKDLLLARLNKQGRSRKEFARDMDLPRDTFFRILRGQALNIKVALKAGIAMEIPVSKLKNVIKNDLSLYIDDIISKINKDQN